MPLHHDPTETKVFIKETVVELPEKKHTQMVIDIDDIDFEDVIIKSSFNFHLCLSQSPHPSIRWGDGNIWHYRSISWMWQAFNSNSLSNTGFCFRPYFRNNRLKQRMWPYRSFFYREVFKCRNEKSALTTFWVRQISKVYISKKEYIYSVHRYGLNLNLGYLRHGFMQIPFSDMHNFLLKPRFFLNYPLRYIIIQSSSFEVVHE